MAVGDTFVDKDGTEYEIVWDGGEGLVEGRETRPIGFWQAPKRIYNKKSEFWATRGKPGVDKDPEEVQDAIELERD